MNAFISGIWLGFSLLVAIGAQNSLILRQGLRQEYVFIVCLMCACSDAILISLGISGFGVFAKVNPWIEEIARDGGALFLIGYGLHSFWLAIKSSDSLLPDTDAKTSLSLIISTCLAFTWLNPHVYLDTMFLIGSVSTSYSDLKIQFALGAISASFIFFFALGYGASKLAPVLNNPVSWKIIEIAIGIIMFLVAISLFL